jgi:WD40 repeat protein
VPRHVVSLKAPFAWFGMLRFSDSGHFLLARCTFNDYRCEANIWGTTDWKPLPLTRAQAAGLWSVDLSPDDRRLAVGYIDGQVKVWSFPAGKQEATWHDHTQGVYAVRFAENGRVLVSTSTDATVQLRDLATQRVSTLRGHVGSAWGAALSPDGRRLVTGGGDTEGGHARDAVILWDLATHRELLSLRAQGQLFVEVGFSPDGSTLVAMSLDGHAHFWRAPSWQEIKAAEKRPMAP